MGRRDKKKRTDYGTVIFHWLLVGSLGIAIATGLRIATEAPDRTWLNFLDPVLPKATVWTEHLQCAAVLVGLTIAYTLYMRRLRLRQRLRLDRVRLWGLLGRPYARWGTVNICLYWLFFLTMLSQLATGALLYLGYANSLLMQAHWLGLWIILAYIALHVLSQQQFGGTAQLLRIFRPMRTYSGIAKIRIGGRARVTRRATQSVIGTPPICFREVTGRSRASLGSAVCHAGGTAGTPPCRDPSRHDCRKTAERPG